MDQRAIVQYISDTYAGVDVVSPAEGIAAGDTFFSYDPDRNLDPRTWDVRSHASTFPLWSEPCEAGGEALWRRTTR